MSNDNLEINKFAASILIAGIVALISAFIADIIYQPSESDVRGYEIAVNEDQGDLVEDTAEEVIDVIAMMTTAQHENGASIAKKCVSCHSFDKDGSHKVGPNLWNIVNKKIASSSDYNYSTSLSSIDKIWDYNELYAFLNAPKKYAKGTKMSFAGLKKPEQIVDLIAYLEKNYK
jgi:cytochrome c